MHRPLSLVPPRIARWAALLSSLALVALAPAQAPIAPRAPRFVANAGQWPAEVRFGVLGGGTQAWVTDRGVVIRLERRDGLRAAGAVLSLEVENGAATAVRGEGLARPPAHFVGRHAAVSAPAFERVRLVAVRPGVDLVLRPDTGGGALAYDLHLAPGADLATLNLRCAGGVLLEPDGDGGLPIAVEMPDGDREVLVQRAPIAWLELADGELRERRVRFDPRGPERFGFAVDGWDGLAPLVVDPGLAWSSYLGGGASDSGLAIAHVPGSGVYVGGWAGSTDFPTTVGAFRSVGGRDAFVAKLTEDGTGLLWSTYLGGSGSEDVRGLAVAADGSVIVGGFTTSADFPVTAGAFQTEYAGGSPIGGLGDAFVAKLTADGSALTWCTYLGRFGDDSVEAVAVAPDGAVTVAGQTDSTTFPTTAGVVQEQFGSINALAADMFVTRLAPDGRDLIWSTYFGGGGHELLGGLRVDDAGRVLIGGTTGSLPPPTIPGAYSRSTDDDLNGIVAVLSADARRLEVSTLCGIQTFDRVEDVCFAPDGSIWAVGTAASEPGATNGLDRAWQRAPAGEEDGFVVHLSADGRELHAATFLGGTGDDRALGVAQAPDGSVLIVGATGSPELPTVGTPAQVGYGGGTSDAFVARLEPGLGAVQALGFVGGRDKDQLWAAVAVDADDLIAVGTTFSDDLPVAANAAQRTFGGAADAFVVRATLPRAAASVELTGTSRLDLARFVGGDRVVGVPFIVRNLSSVDLQIDAVEVVVGGSANPLSDLGGVSIHVDLDGDGELDPGEPGAGGPIWIADVGRVVRVPTSGLTVAGLASLQLLAVVDSRAGCQRGAEIVASVADPSGLEIRDRADGRRVLVRGSASLPVRGATHYCDARREYSGDLDADGLPTCRDVRWLAQRLGTASLGELEAADADGDGAIGVRDVDLLFDRVLSRVPAWLPQTELSAGGLLLVSGFELPSELIATVAGAELPLVLGDGRCAAFALPLELRAGTVEARILDRDGEELARGELIVR